MWKALDHTKTYFDLKCYNSTVLLFRDDFMMGAKMKDWDKESVDEWNKVSTKIFLVMHFHF